MRELTIRDDCDGAPSSTSPRQLGVQSPRLLSRFGLDSLKGSMSDSQRNEMRVVLVDELLERGKLS